MTLQQLSKVHGLSGRKELFVLLGSITRNIMVVDKVGGTRNVEGRFCGTFHLQGLTIHLHRTISLHICTALSSQSSRNTFLFHTLNRSRQSFPFSLHSQWELTLMRQNKVQSTFLTGFHIYDNHTISQRSHHTTGVCHLIALIRSGVHTRLKVELTHIILDFLMTKVQIETAQGQETHAMRTFDEITVDDVLGFLFLAIKNKATHLCESLQRSSTVVVVRTTTPESFLIELDFFCVCATIYHSAHARIAQRQCFQPNGGRTVIPKALGVVSGFTCCA